METVSMTLDWAAEIFFWEGSWVENTRKALDYVKIKEEAAVGEFLDLCSEYFNTGREECRISEEEFNEVNKLLQDERQTITSRE